MAFNEIELQRIKKFVGGLCTKRTPAHLRDKLRLEYNVEKHNVIIYEVRPLWNNPKEFGKYPMAKLTYVASKKIWKLYWQRANLKWAKYDPKESARYLDELVKEIDNDRYGCFFG